MRTYSPIRIGVFSDPGAQKEIHKTNIYLRQLSTQIARLPALPQGTPSQNGSPGTFDLTNFLYLPGRENGQFSRKKVTFETKTITAAGTTPQPSQYGVGFTCYTNGVGEIPTAWLSIEETQAGRPSRQNRDWVFPAFNMRSSGDNIGYHYFVDQDTAQRLTGPKVMVGCEYEMKDVAGIGFSFDAVGDRASAGTGVQTCNIIFAPNFNQSAWPYSSSTPVNGIQPHIYIPPLDIGTLSTGGNPSPREKKHALAILRTGSPNTPFEKGSIIGSSFSGRELYPMPTTAHGTFVVPIGAEVPQFWPTTTLTDCGMTTGTNIITTLNSAGVKVGMRITPNISGSAPNWETFGDDIFVIYVDPTTIHMSTNWSGSNVTNQTLNFFGPIWQTPAGLAASIDHGALAGLADDDHPQYLLLAGRSGTNPGQVIGSGTHTGGTATDIALEGRLIVGDASSATNYLPGTGVLVRQNAANNSSAFSVTQVLTALSGVASGTISGATIGLLGAPVYSSGSWSIQGFSFAATTNVPGGTVLTDYRGAQIAASLGTAIGNVNTGEGALITINGPTINSGGSTFAEMGGIDCGASNRAAPATFIYGVRIRQPAGGSYGGAVTDAVGIEFSATQKYANAATVATWHGLRIPTIPLPTNAWALDIDDIKSRHTGEVAIGWTPATNAAVTAFLHLGPSGGGAGSAPLKLTTGTSLGTPEAGAAEYDGSKLYMTHGDAVRTMVETQRGAVNATAQTAAIGATTLYAAPAAGYYVVDYTLECTTADAGTPAVSVQFQVNYTDDIGATNQTGAALSLAVTGRDRGSFQVWCNAAQNIQYQTNVVTIGTAQYALRARLTHLG